MGPRGAESMCDDHVRCRSCHRQSSRRTRSCFRTPHPHPSKRTRQTSRLWFTSGVVGATVNDGVGAEVFEKPRSAIDTVRTAELLKLLPTGTAWTTTRAFADPRSDGGAVTVKVARPSEPVVTSPCDTRCRPGLTDPGQAAGLRQARPWASRTMHRDRRLRGAITRQLIGRRGHRHRQRELRRAGQRRRAA